MALSSFQPDQHQQKAGRRTYSPINKDGDGICTAWNWVDYHPVGYKWMEKNDGTIIVGPMDAKIEISDSITDLKEQTKSSD